MNCVPDRKKETGSRCKVGIFTPDMRHTESICKVILRCQLSQSHETSPELPVVSFLNMPPVRVIYF